MKNILIWLFIVGAAISFVLAIPELQHVNEGESKSVGSVRAGQLENGYLVPYRGTNYSFFSPSSYYLGNNGYLHSRVHRAVLDAYRQCEQTCPGIHFRLMECSDKYGGKLLIHRTHQNGTSVDFMVPKKNLSTGRQTTVLDGLGFWHYLLDFDDNGRFTLNRAIEIDFEALGKHILAIDDAAKRNGLSIRKVILKVELKDELYATASGKEIRSRGIYLVQGLPELVNRVHDDHYHIDFTIL